MEPIDYTNFKFRCSQLGKLMTGVSVGLTENQEVTFTAYDERYKGDGKPLTEKQLADYFELGAKKYGKKVGLSVTAMNYLRDIHKEHVFSRSKEIRNKYTDKGIQVEAYTMSIFCRVFKTLVVEDKKRITNDFITGELDTRDTVKKIVREFKSSWDFSTFPFFDTECPNSDYDWQVQGYMDLTGYDEAQVIYGLVDTPSQIINDELRRLDWKHNIFSIDGDVKTDRKSLVIETVSNLLYSEKGLEDFCNESTSIYKDWFKNFKPISEEQRVKVFPIRKDENKINAFKNQIVLCREFLNKLSGFSELKKAV